MTLSSEITSILWISLVAYSMIQGYLLFMVFPTYRSGSRQAKWILATTSLICALVLTEELIKNTVGYEGVPNLIFAFSPLWYLFGPLIFLYIRLYTRNKKISWKDSWHILPALWVIYSSIPFYQFPAAIKLQYLQNVAVGDSAPIHNINYVVFCIQSVYYVVVSALLLKTSGSTKKPQQRWLRQLVLGLSLITCLGVLSLFIINVGQSVFAFTTNLYIIWVSAFLLIMFLKSVRSPKELYIIGKPPTIQKDTKLIYDRLCEFMKEQEPFKDPQYDIQTLSRSFGYSKNYLNLLIKEHTELSFRDYINLYRVEEAKKKLNSPLSKQYTIQSIANDSGFTSLATFYRVFKKVEGKTPKSFIKH